MAPRRRTARRSPRAPWASGAISARAVGGSLGIAEGLGIGLLTVGFGKQMDLIGDQKHRIAELQIG
jgi:hypothetical protein